MLSANIVDQMVPAEKSLENIVGSSQAAENFLARHVVVVVVVVVVDFVAPAWNFQYPRRDHAAESRSVPSVVISASSLVEYWKAAAEIVCPESNFGPHY